MPVIHCTRFRFKDENGCEKAGNAWFAERLEEKSHHHTTDKCAPTNSLPLCSSPRLLCSLFFFFFLQCLQLWQLQQWVFPPLWCFLAVGWLLDKMPQVSGSLFFLFCGSCSSIKTAEWSYLGAKFPFIFRKKEEVAICYFSAWTIGPLIYTTKGFHQCDGVHLCVCRFREFLWVLECVHRRWSSHTEIIYQTLLSRIKVT